MNEPDMPGRIIAQIAIAPLRKTNQAAEGVSTGTAPTRTKAPAAASSKASASFTVQRDTFPRTVMIDASTSPKKKAQTWTGW